MSKATTIDGPSPIPWPIPHIQMGFGALPEAGSSAHLSILRQWLSHCDSQHTCCKSLETSHMPTRLIEVGAENDPMVRLYETRPDDSVKYVALSHAWGAGPHFCTTLANIESQRRYMPLDILPMTYQDAITVTRRLDIRYLWIDAICIIQGDGGDFDMEAKRMEDVFSQAYLVLAASSATSQQDGFLKPRKAPKSIQLKAPSNEAAIHIRRFIDDFDRYALQSPLHKMAWKLKERAFARRTIYFTSVQTFWECGSGVRCETMTKMNK